MAEPSPGRRIRLRRQALKLSQQELADRVGVNRATVSAWERGKQLPVRNEGAIEAVLGISLTGPDDDPAPLTADERAVWNLTALPPRVRRDLIDLMRERRDVYLRAG